MNLIGIEKLVYGVKDLDQCKSFWRDFGLSVSEDDDQHGLFTCASGAKVEVRRNDDPSLPPPVVAALAPWPEENGGAFVEKSCVFHFPTDGGERQACRRG